MQDVVVYGASGYTGKLICAELNKQNVSFAIAGRDEKKLRALGYDVPVLVAALDDAEALRKMAESARVVLDCAGPFVKWGKPVQDAALATRRHFLDITGEQQYMRDTFARDAEAKAAGVALINAVGFDVVPTDCAAALAAEAAGAPVDKVRIAFAQKGAGPSQGTARSFLESAHLGSVAWVDGEWRREPVATEVWEVPFPNPIGPRTCVSIPWGDVATAPRSTGAREVRTFMSMKLSYAKAARMFGKLLGLAPIHALGERWIRSQPEGPDEEARRRSAFGVVAEAIGKNGRRAVWVTGGNGYDFTASAAVWCARRVIEVAPKGALTPSQAFGGKNLLDGLADVVTWGYAE